ncbi:hypothetical protein TNCV_1401111 [Trichonephila clavipes]|nr:hypothetical protein TNCV_1401111 [Trichonephila clavipes]
MLTFLQRKDPLVIQRLARISTIFNEYSSIRLCSNMAFKHNFKTEVAEMSKDKNWAILNKNPSWVPGAPKKAAVAQSCFRLLTVPDCLRSHLYSIGIADSPDCVLCVTLVSLRPMNIWSCAMH